MARDRQRSKARQRARAAQQKGGKPARAPKEPQPVEDEVVENDELLEGEIATPGPLEHSSSAVDEAQLAEAGVPVPAPTEDEDEDQPEELEDDFDRAPDELELPPDLREEGTRGAGGGGGGGDVTGLEGEEPGPRKERGRLATFLRGCVDELRRVQWPDRPHVFQATAVVLGFCLVAGGFLGLMDALFQPLIEAIL